MKKLIIFFIPLLVSFTVCGQIGTSKIGQSAIAKDSLLYPTIGKGKTPRCALPVSCDINCAIYTFTGSGNWSIEGNWAGGLKPPAVLDGCVQIVINPKDDKECVLNIPLQIIPNGASIVVMENKKFRVPGTLIRQ